MPSNPSTPNGSRAGTAAGTGASLPVSRRAAIFVVKSAHSLIFLGVAASVLHVFYAGVLNRASRWTVVALAIALGESLVFAVNRFRCPLRGLAEDLGAESGQVTDIFLPRWFADRIPWFFTPPLVAGILALLWHRRTGRRAGRPGPTHLIPSQQSGSRATNP